MAYPNDIVSFSAKVDNKDVIWAAHINALQTETRLVEQTLGSLILNKGVPVVWDAGKESWRTVKERLDWVGDGLVYFASRQNDYIEKSGPVTNVIQQPGDHYVLAIRNNHPTPALQIWGSEIPNSHAGAPITLSGHTGRITARYFQAFEDAGTSIPVFWGRGHELGTGELLKLDVGEDTYLSINRDGKVTSQGNLFGGTTLPKLGLSLGEDTGSSTGLIRVDAASAASGNLVYFKKTQDANTWLTTLTVSGVLTMSTPTGVSYFNADNGTAKLHRTGGTAQLAFGTTQSTDDVRLRASGGQSGAPGQGTLNIDAKRAVVGSDAGSTVTLNGGVLMPHMQTTYFYAEDKALFIKRRGNSSFDARPGYWDRMYASSSDDSGLFDTSFNFTAPASGSVLCTLSAELYANCSLTAVSYRITQAGGSVVLDYNHKQGILHNAFTENNTNDVQYMTVTSPYHVNNLVPGATYVVDIRAQRWIPPTSGGYAGLQWTQVRDLRMYVQPMFSTVAVVR